MAARNGKIVCLYFIIFIIVKKNSWRFCGQKSHDARARLQSLQERGRKGGFRHLSPLMHHGWAHAFRWGGRTVALRA